LQPPTDGAATDPDPRFLLQLLAQFVEGGVWHSRDKVGQLPQLGLGEFRAGPTAMRQGGEVPAFALLAQQFVKEGFVHAAPGGDLTVAAELPPYGINYSFSQV
jgi:hypothetical protein